MVDGILITFKYERNIKIAYRQHKLFCACKFLIDVSVS